MLAAPVSFAKDRYISDNLFTYMHAGPSNQFRIIGSVNAGDKITLVAKNRETGYSQVVDSKGRKGWVESKYVSTRPSMAERLPKLEKGLVDSLESRNEQIKELEKNYADMNKQLTASQSEVRELRAKLDTQKEDLLLKYFMYGGGVAGIGLILGLILPHLIPRRKKSPSGWA
jgi:SH3 domain protein